MESEDFNLESLIDLIDETEPSEAVQETDQNNVEGGAKEPNEAELDTLFSLIVEDESTCSTPGPATSQKKDTSITLSELNFSDTAGDSSSVPSALHCDASSLIHTGDTSDEEYDEQPEDKVRLTETGHMIKGNINQSLLWRTDKKKESKTFLRSKSVLQAPSSSSKHESLDKLTGIRIVNPLVSFSTMESRLRDRKLLKMSFLKSFINKNNDIEGDWVTVGVLVRKIPPKTAKNGKLYSIWKLTDLYSVEKVVSAFLFGESHKQLWKTAVGTVVGILNPIIMEPNDKDDGVTLNVDHPGKLMLIGSSKDMGHCQSKTRDGSKCPNIVNMSECQYCTYHVKKEYRKLGTNTGRSSSWSGNGSNFKDKVLKGQNFFYGGQTFTPLGKQGKKASVASKDKLTLANLTLRRKAVTVLNEEKSKSVNKIAQMYGESVSKTAEKNSEFINNKLLIPSAGSRNILKHMKKEEITQEDKMLTTNPRELLHQNALQSKSPLNGSNAISIVKNLRPMLGKGLNPGQTLTFDAKSPNSSAHSQYAKMRAIRKINENGPIKRKNPNSVKSNPEPKKIKAVLESSLPVNPADEKTEEKLAWSKLGFIDLNSEKVQKILNRKSSHAYEVEMAIMEREAAYFERMEKREMMEEKMCSTKEIVCDVVSCKQCRYTADKAAERCKEEGHPLKCHKAIKRFFACKDCKNRTDSFSRFPLRSCSHCKGSRFERTGMAKIRSGPKLESETFNLTGDDAYFLNSL